MHSTCPTSPGWSREPGFLFRKSDIMVMLFQCHLLPWLSCPFFLLQNSEKAQPSSYPHHQLLQRRFSPVNNIDLLRTLKIRFLWKSLTSTSRNSRNERWGTEFPRLSSTSRQSRCTLRRTELPSSNQTLCRRGNRALWCNSVLWTNNFNQTQPTLY